MSDLEKELVEKLAKALRIALDKPYSFCVLVQRELLPLIHSHTQALVAAAYAACADAASQDAQVIVTSLGNMESGDATGEELDRAMKAAMNIRPRLCKLTPADAARELERIKATCERLAALEAQAKEKPTKPDAQEGFLHKLTKEEVKNCAENPDYEEEP